MVDYRYGDRDEDLGWGWGQRDDEHRWSSGREGGRDRDRFRTSEQRSFGQGGQSWLDRGRDRDRDYGGQGYGGRSGAGGGQGYGGENYGAYGYAGQGYGGYGGGYEGRYYGGSNPRGAMGGAYGGGADPYSFRGDRGRNELDWEDRRNFSGGADRGTWTPEGQHRGRGPKGYRRSDERIREDVNERLMEDHRLDATDIEVEVQNGEVTLNGVVESREDKRRAEDLVERCSGVGHVQNNLRIQQQTQGSSGDWSGVSSPSAESDAGSMSGASASGTTTSDNRRGRSSRM